MKAYQLTLAEYKNEVTPLLRKLFDFAKAHKQYMFPGDFNGVVLVDFATATKNRYGGYTVYSEEEKADLMARDLQNGTGLVPVRELPDAVRAQYEAIIAELGEYFDAEQLVAHDRRNLTLQRDELSSNKREVARAVSRGYYADDIDNGIMSIERVKEIFDSLGKRMPSSLEKQEEERKRILLFKSNPAMREFMDSILDSFKPERDKYTQRLRDLYNTQSARYLEKVQFAKGSFDRERIQKSNLAKNLLANHTRLFGYDEKGVLSKRPDFDAQLEKLIAFIVEEMGNQMVGALCGKVSMVLSTLVNVKKNYMRSGYDGFEGSFTFTLENGSFDVDTQSIYVHGEIQRPHFRYLAHYKFVTKDGEHYGSMTFEKMIRLFGKALV